MRCCCVLGFILCFMSAGQCNKKRIVDYPNIWGYLRELYQTPGFGETTNFHHIEEGYQVTHKNEKMLECFSIDYC